MRSQRRLLRKNKRIIYAAVLLTTGIYFFLMGYLLGKKSDSLSSTESPESLLNIQEKETEDYKDRISILLWTNYHSDGPFEMLRKIEEPEGEGWLKNPLTKTIQCPKVKRCRFIRDRSNLQFADGVVFHAKDLEVMHRLMTNSTGSGNISGFNSSESLGLPHLLRSQSQPWIFLQRESPSNTEIDLTRYPNVYNWTMTYRSDSDVPFPYGKTVPVINASSKEVDSLYSSFFRSKSEGNQVNATKPKNAGKVAWVSSNCKAKSQREQLVKNLANFIPVHIYGKCGDRTCRSGKADDPGCLGQLEKDYKFYLAFENSLCEEYVSEILFNALNHSILPVVYGHAQYDQIAPRGSFINAREFGSVRDLGEYLNYLDENDEEYEKYFEWKKSFKVEETDKGAWCDLCHKLYENKKDVNRRLQWYSDLHFWWYNFTDSYAAAGGSERKNRFLQFQYSEADSSNNDHKNSVEHTGKAGSSEEPREMCVPPPKGLVGNFTFNS